MAVIRQTKPLFLALCVLAPGYLAAQGPQFSIQDLGTLSGLAACNGTALSQSGDVVGYCTAQSGQNLLISSPATHVFLYSKGKMSDLGVPSLATPFPTGVNDSGVVVGGAVTVNVSSLSGTASPFIYENGKFQNPPAQINNAIPLAVNNAGQIIATSLQISGGSLNFFVQSSAFLDSLSADTVTKLTAAGGGSSAALGINSSGTIAGATVPQNANGSAPLLWQGSTPTTLPQLAGFSNAIATSVNDSGVAVGEAFTIDFTKLVDSNATGHAVLYQNGSANDLGVLPSDVSSAALGINDSGAVVGFSSSSPPTFSIYLAALIAPPANKYHAFVYSGGKMYDLTKQLVNGSGWQLSFATQINNAGQIVGTGLINGAQHAFLLTPVLAPTTSTIAGAGLSTPPITTISPNGVLAVYGDQLSAASFQTIQPGDIVNNQLPTILGGTCVESGTTRWNLFFVSPKQLNVLAGELPASGTVPVKVVTNCGTANEVASATVNLTVASVAPEFLLFPTTSEVAATEATNGSSPTGTYIGPPGLLAGATFAPAHPGDVLVAYGVGWGTTTPAVPIGTLDPGLSSLPDGSYSLTLGGMPVQVSYAGLTPTQAGLYQINFIVPSGLSAGNQPLVLKVDGVSTPAAAVINVAN